MSAKNILYVEDEKDDILLLQKAFRDERIDKWLHVARTGPQGMAWLAGDGEFADRNRYPQPQLVLLDLWLPETDGMEVLRWIREQPALAALPVIMFSGSYRQSEFQEAQHLGANAFLEKPKRPDELKQIARFLWTWLQFGVQPPMPAKRLQPSVPARFEHDPAIQGRERFPLHKPQGFRTWGD